MIRTAPLLLSCALLPACVEAQPDEVGVLHTAEFASLTEDPAGPGSAVTERFDDHVDVSVEATMTPGDAVTLWACGWNEPARCRAGAGQCDGTDLFENPASAPFCYYAAGAVVGDDGSVALDASLPVGRTDGELLFGAPIADGDATELWWLLHSHGPVLDDRLDAQLTTYLGGCPPNDCETQQGAHVPPAAAG